MPIEFPEEVPGTAQITGLDGATVSLSVLETKK